jgi:hypothetical protein
MLEEQSISGFPREPDDHDPNHKNTSHSSEHLSPMEPKGLIHIVGSLPDPDAEHANEKSTDIREHMGSVCQNGEGAGGDTADDLHDHEEEADEHHEEQLTKGFVALGQLLLKCWVRLQDANVLAWVRIMVMVMVVYM